ncbi:hypothetical protein HMPREF1126_1007 [Streptococcus anginosus SK1138]|uniref:Uncharacterized protein n=1 Tax=Streptococcus anginosus SK1138 TaxID=1161422 RepID=A0AAD2Y9M1_STRAP|nr:hypothetical protein HMPREF1126_1007 [Streptococcus anginosus SK1138]
MLKYQIRYVSTFFNAIDKLDRESGESLYGLSYLYPRLFAEES